MTTTQLILDAGVSSKLHEILTPINLCDPSGRLLGRFVPLIDRSLYEGMEPQITKEEIQRRKQEKGKTYTTAEVLDSLNHPA